MAFQNMMGAVVPHMVLVILVLRALSSPLHLLNQREKEGPAGLISTAISVWDCSQKKPLLGAQPSR